MTRLREKSGFSSLLILILSSIAVVTTTVLVDLKLGQRLKQAAPEIFQQGPYPSVTPPSNSCSGKQVKDCCGTNGQCVSYSGYLVCYGCPSGGSCVAGKGCVTPEPTETCVTNGGVCFEQSCSSLNRSSVSGSCSGGQFCCGNPLICRNQGQACSSNSPCCSGLVCSAFSGGSYCVSPECTNGEKRCSGSYVQECQNRRWVPVKNCATGCSSVTKDCNHACDAGKKECLDSNTLRTCANDGSGWSRQSCPYGCENGACKPQPAPSVAPLPECAAGAHKCTGDNFYSCYYGYWRQDGTCNGRGCKNSSECNPATECTGTESTCEGNTRKFCSAGLWNRVTCSYGCEAGMCNECSSGAHKCANDTFYSCYYSYWRQDGTCNGRGCKNSSECNPATECTGTETKCENGNKKFCSSGRWATFICTYGCENGDCRSQPPQSACYCSNNIMQGDACDSLIRGKPCNLPSPTPSTGCTAGQHKCTGDNFYSCYYGYWRQDGNCGGQGCKSDSECNPPAPCIHGDTRCAGSNTKELCTYGAWVRSDCPHGCEGGECKPPPPLIPWIPVEPVGPEYVVGPSPAPITATQPLQINPYRDYCAGLTGQEYEDCRAADRAEYMFMAGAAGVSVAAGAAAGAIMTAPIWGPTALAAGGAAYAVTQPYMTAATNVGMGAAVGGGIGATVASAGLAITEELEESGTITPSQAQPWYNALGSGFRAGQYALSQGSRLRMQASNLNSIAGAFVSSSPIANQAYQVQTTEMEVRRVMRNLPTDEYTIEVSEGISYKGSDQIIQSELNALPGQTSPAIKIDLNNPTTREFIARGVVIAGQSGVGQVNQALGISDYTRANIAYSEMVEQVLQTEYGYGGGSIPLSVFIRQGVGVCYERAIINAAIMDALHWENPQLVAGELIRDERMGVADLPNIYHAQTQFTTPQYGRLIVDPDQPYVGTLHTFLETEGFSNFREIERVTIGQSGQ